MSSFTNKRVTYPTLSESVKDFSFRSVRSPVILKNKLILKITDLFSYIFKYKSISKAIKCYFISNCPIKTAYGLSQIT